MIQYGIQDVISQKTYLKGLLKEDIPATAAPARETDYSNLPPAYTFVGATEPFYVETVTYIDNLKKAGVKAHVDVYQQWFHAYDIVFPFKQISKEAIAAFEKQYLYAVEHYVAKQK